MLEIDRSKFYILNVSSEAVSKAEVQRLEDIIAKNNLPVAIVRSPFDAFHGCAVIDNLDSIRGLIQRAIA